MNRGLTIAAVGYSRNFVSSYCLLQRILENLNKLANFEKKFKILVASKSGPHVERISLKNNLCLKSCATVPLVWFGFEYSTFYPGLILNVFVFIGCELRFRCVEMCLVRGVFMKGYGCAEMCLCRYFCVVISVQG
jgi:hypothetical protein